ncbi:MAG: PilZ domain-containing protein [Candidatus Omnitrophica bacterium]|nr:PilZ domain-containing protein [Candidatus Omnitrophota bacterium]MDD5430260.1 PilZ domain-containing protein [Candidatus Omnitrophota bacterium]
MTWNGKEKRRFVRASYPCKIAIFAPDEAVFTVNTENIGAGGIRVILGRELRISLLADLEVFLKDKIIKCKGRIVWVIKKDFQASDASANYDTGIEFYRISEEDRKFIKNVVESLASGQ